MIRLINLLDKAAETVCGALLPALLFISGAVIFISLSGYLLRPRFYRNNFKNGSLSSLWLALGGTLGVGNICGVCAAIYTGGAGCVFWIWVCAFISAATKYAETVLAVKYRKKRSDGTFRGGAPYYISEGLGMKRTASLFAVLCIVTAFTMGNATQIRAASEFNLLSFGMDKWLSAVIFATALLSLTLGKGRLIGAFTSHAVPFLCIGYSLLCAASLFIFRENIPHLTKAIINEAFTPRAGACGLTAYLSSPAVRLGITRGVMSNEAGCGTAPFAYAENGQADARSCGLLGIVEVLIDTLLLCTLTAYAVLLPQIPLSESSAISVINAFSAVIGRAAAPFLSVAISLFAVASASAWSFYAMRSAEFLGAKKGFHIIFPILYSMTAFFSCFSGEGVLWLVSDLTVALMAIINMTAVTLMIGKVRSISADVSRDLPRR